MKGERDMSDLRRRRSAAGGLTLLAAAGYICWKGLKAVDRRLEQRRNKTSGQEKQRP